MRSHKEVAQLVEKTVAEIKEGKITDEVIHDTCKKYDIDQLYIRRLWVTGGEIKPHYNG